MDGINNYIKPKVVNISDDEYIKELISVNLRKDLHDDEEVCQYCHGTGMVIVDNPYGLDNEPDRRCGYFPYKHQSISFCHHCYNGVVHRCKLCGEIMKQGYLKHDCEQQKNIDREIANEKEKEEFNKATVINSDIPYYLYCDKISYNDGYFDDWEEFFESWHEEHENDDEKPEFVWSTEPQEMKIDAESIIENATEDLYEDAISDISTDEINKLQDYLDEWCKKCGVRTTYYISHKYKVRIPWEQEGSIE